MTPHNTTDTPLATPSSPPPSMSGGIAVAMRINRRSIFHAVQARQAVFLAALAVVAGYPQAARAQITQVGLNPLLVTTTVRGSDVAYDPVNKVYLVVGAYGSVWGSFTTLSGDLISAFPINAPGPFAHFPRVIYSPDVSNGVGGVGGFIVTWHESPGGANFVNTRVVAYPAGPVSLQQTIAAPVGTWWESGASIAYSTTSRVSLVTWRSADYLIWGARLDVNGNLIGTAFQISQTGQGARDPSVAWNSATDQFGIIYDGWGATSTQTTFTLVTSGGAVVANNIFNFAGSAGTYITDLAYNPVTGRFVGVWVQTGAGTLGAEFDGAGTVVASGLVSSTTGAVDGLGLSYNPVTGTFLLVGMGPSYNIWGAELNAHGAKTSIDQQITAAALPAGEVGSFYPRAAARSDAAQWNVSFSHNYTELHDQIVSSTSTGGGPGGSLGAVVGGTSTPPAPQPLAVTLTQTPAATVSEGTPITWTATSTGGTAPIQYEFITLTKGVWTILQPYGASNTFTWFPTEGAHAVQVWAKNGGSANDAGTYDAYASSQFTVASRYASIASLQADATMPVDLNIPVTWTATGIGGTGPLQYKFLATSNGGVTWRVMQDYSANNKFTWFPPLGVTSNAVQVWVRSAGVTTDPEGWMSSGLFTTRSTGARLMGVSSDAAAPVTPFTNVTITAAGAGGSGQLEYKFYLYNPGTGTWSLVRDWGTSPQASWNPSGTTGLFLVQVWVRTVNSGVTYEDWRNTDYFSITTSTSLTLTSDRSLTTLHQGDIVTFTATVLGGSGAWEYQFFTFDGTSWMRQLPLYKSANTFGWFPAAGTRAVQVWIRQAGSSAPWERWAGSGLFVVNP